MFCGWCLLSNPATAYAVVNFCSTVWYAKRPQNPYIQAYVGALEATVDGLEGVFNAFTHDAPNMDGRTFVKLCKDCKVLDKFCTPTDVDLIFTKVKAKGAKTITFAEFEGAIALIAEKKKISVPELGAQISAASGPVYSGTKALPNKFHDDKSLYTGVHANGGPSTVDGNINDISQILDRSAANVRGVKM
ncbi:UNVERIFIED_CONTAM: hypothetical protein H355_011883 [Colinus virginianus]|nr:hypothetical protein H355_011883 [Colinus virginianus]